MDGLTLAASVVELRSLIGGRIEKIQQPERFELLFVVHANAVSQRLLISASPDNCRIHITEEKRASPIDAPNFLMLLRKHLQNSRITSIEQPNADRIVIIRFASLTELYDTTEFCLICEIMGKHSNIILTDGNGIILDSVRRVSADMSSMRLILPRLTYEYPPTQTKKDPFLASAKDFSECLSKSDRKDKALSSEFYGLSPSISAMLIDAIIYRCGLTAYDSDEIGRELFHFYEALNGGQAIPCIADFGDRNTLLPFTPAIDSFTRFNTMHEAADEFYRLRSQTESIKRRTASIEKILSNNIQRLERKIEKFSMAIGDEAEIESLRLSGELITANLYRIPAHARCIKLENYHVDPPKPMAIELDPMLSASDNAQNYYKRYRKAKSAMETAIIQRDSADQELEYLCGISSDLSRCLNEADFEEIKAELTSQGYIKAAQTKRSKPPKSKPHRFISSDGIEILVGKNNTQNDKLTFKEARPDNIWLHTKGIHGSHVIVCSEDSIPDRTLFEAAQLAAYYSQARESAQVPVDYTRRKFVKKPSGAKPGMVIYTNQKTLYVNPELCLK